MKFDFSKDGVETSDCKHLDFKFHAQNLNKSSQYIKKGIGQMHPKENSKPSYIRRATSG